MASPLRQQPTAREMTRGPEEFGRRGLSQHDDDRTVVSRHILDGGEDGILRGFRVDERSEVFGEPHRRGGFRRCGDELPGALGLHLGDSVDQTLLLRCLERQLPEEFGEVRR